MFVFIAQVLAIIVFLSTSEDNSIGGLGASINCIWTWMIPVCLGWVWVGTQTSHLGIKDALTAASESSTRESFAGIRVCTEDRTRILADSGEDFEMQPLRDEHPEAWSSAVVGDAIEPGPIHNYTRLWTHMAVALNFVTAFKTMHLRLGGTARLSVNGEPWNDEEYETNLIGDPQQMAGFICIKDKTEEMNPFPAKSPPGTLNRMLIATLVCLFMQWGTTGSAIIIAY